MQDGLGSVRDNALNYSPFGVPDAAVEGFAFTGEVRDANGLQFHRARYYAPELGVWPSLDPLELGNRYAYVNGNPATMVDPLGLQSITDPRRSSCNNGDWVCLLPIMAKLDLLAAGGSIGADIYAGAALTYYLRGASESEIRRRPVYINPMLLVNDTFFREGVNREVQTQIMINTNFHSFVNGYCLNSTSNSFAQLDIGSPWQVNNIRVGNKLFRTLGGSEIRPYNQSVIVNIISDSGTDLTISVTQEIEFYDFYDWCGVSHNCPPDEIDQGLFQRQADPNSSDYDPDYATNPERGLGTPDHPFGFYVGDFTAVEQAGLAKPYDMYSSWMQTNIYQIPHSCGAPASFGNASLIDSYYDVRELQHPFLIYEQRWIGGIATGESRPVILGVPVMGDLEANGYVPSPLHSPNARPY